MANTRAEELAKNLDNENVLTFLDLISAAEGTTDFGYKTAFGGGELASLADHPRTLKEFTQTDGKKNKSSAAGRYQFLEGTWDDVAKRLALDDFGERSQDLGALELIRRAGALDDVRKGDFASALKKTGKTWASLPSSPYPQPKKSAEWVEQFLAANAMETAAKAEEAEIERRFVPTADLPVQQVAQAGMGAGNPPVNNFNNSFGSMPPSDVFQAASGTPDWASRLAQIQGADASLEMAEEPWEEQLLSMAIAQDGDAARSESISRFFGEDPAPAMTLPRQIERAINKLIAQL